MGACKLQLLLAFSSALLSWLRSCGRAADQGPNLSVSQKCDCWPKRNTCGSQETSQQGKQNTCLVAASATVLLHGGGAIKRGHARGDSKNVGRLGCAHGSDSSAGAALTTVASAKAGATANAAIQQRTQQSVSEWQHLNTKKNRESRNF